MMFNRDTLFVGSMNLDPRSINLNTEIGVLIYSKNLAEYTSQAFLEALPTHAWRLDIETAEHRWDQLEQLIWLDVSTTPATIISRDSEPEVADGAVFKPGCMAFCRWSLCFKRDLQPIKKSLYYHQRTG